MIHRFHELIDASSLPESAQRFSVFLEISRQRDTNARIVEKHVLAPELEYCIFNALQQRRPQAVGDIRVRNVSSPFAGREHAACAWFALRPKPREKTQTPP
jgi:hypothetical protein